MLRSAATPNRTEVQSSPTMKQTTIRQLLPTLTVSVRFRCALAATKNLAEINLPRSLV
jgi:hypothetical protein